MDNAEEKQTPEETNGEKLNDGDKNTPDKPISRRNAIRKLIAGGYVQVTV